MKNNISYCNFDCKNCSIYKATVSDNEEEKLEVAKKYNIDLSEVNCLGCKSKQINLMCKNCKIRKESMMEEVVKKPIVTIEMENGEIIKLELYPKKAPQTVMNFISLINKGFYNGLTFHRTIPGFMAQGGDPKGNGTGGPGYGIKGEFKDNGVENSISHVRGILSMARSSMPNSAGSQFFIVTDDSEFLDGQYAAFGSVIEGMNVVDEIVNSEVVSRSGFSMAKDMPVNPPVMKKVTVETFGVNYDEPEKY